MKQVKVGVLVGSLRKGSYSRSVAEAFMGRLPEGFAAEIIEIGDLALYNQDFDDEGRAPAPWQAFRAKAGEMDAFVFVTPEYNRSFPAVIKNAMDIGSRPFKQNVWDGKPAAIISVSPGKMGAFGANHHLRQLAAVLNLYVMQQPEAYLGGIGDSLDPATGKVSSESLLGFLQVIADGFVRWSEFFLTK